VKGNVLSPDRLALFADPLSPLSAVLVDAALRAAAGRPDLRVVALCDTAFRPQPGQSRCAFEIVLANLVERLFDRGARRFRPPALVGSVRQQARRFGVPLIVPPHRDVNEPSFVAHLREVLRPTMALSLGCAQVLRRDLLDLFEIAVNHHSALLPHYRGLHTTSWSLYHGEPVTGFTYHRMTENIDAGPILISGSLQVPAGATVGELERRKARAAAAKLGELLDLMVARSPGTPQSGAASYYSRRAYRAMIAVDSPGEFTLTELQRRLRAFQVLRLRLGGDVWEVSRLVPERGRLRGATTFRTADGVTVRATRFRSLPLPLYRLLRRLLGLSAHG
jgi:methionyl-tRNA formyltransferase